MQNGKLIQGWSLFRAGNLVRNTVLLKLMKVQQVEMCKSLKEVVKTSALNKDPTHLRKLVDNFLASKLKNEANILSEHFMQTAQRHLNLNIPFFSNDRKGVIQMRHLVIRRQVNTE